MAQISPIQLWDHDKLELLRKMDHHREWHSLDEKRYCIACGSIITGRDILIVGDGPAAEPLRAICPTDECQSIPMDWVRPTDEVLTYQAKAAQNVRFQSPIPDQAA